MSLNNNLFFIFLRCGLVVTSLCFVSVVDRTLRKVWYLWTFHQFCTCIWWGSCMTLPQTQTSRSMTGQFSLSSGLTWAALWWLDNLQHEEAKSSSDSVLSALCCDCWFFRRTLYVCVYNFLFNGKLQIMGFVLILLALWELVCDRKVQKSLN